MTNPSSPQLTPKWSTKTENLDAKSAATVNCDAAPAKSFALEASAPWAAFSMFTDSLRLLGCFSVGKEGRLSQKKSAQLCDLMNAWN